MYGGARRELEGGRQKQISCILFLSYTLAIANSKQNINKPAMSEMPIGIISIQLAC